jgi:hypothetical protein
VPALEPVAAMRVVAGSDALDGARWSGDDVDVVRIAPDEALGLGATGVDVDDPDAIVEPETGFSAAILGRADVASISAHADWPLPGPGELAQGKVGGVPVKLVAGEPALLIVQTAYADELAGRLGW